MSPAIRAKQTDPLRLFFRFTSGGSLWVGDCYIAQISKDMFLLLYYFRHTDIPAFIFDACVSEPLNSSDGRQEHVLT